MVSLLRDIPTCITPGRILGSGFPLEWQSTALDTREALDLASILLMRDWKLSSPSAPPPAWYPGALQDVALEILGTQMAWLAIKATCAGTWTRLSIFDDLENTLALRKAKNIEKRKSSKTLKI